jgi:hypothetical protein
MDVDSGSVGKLIRDLIKIEGELYAAQVVCSEFLNTAETRRSNDGSALYFAAMCRAREHEWAAQLHTAIITIVCGNSAVGMRIVARVHQEAADDGKQWIKTFKALRKGANSESQTTWRLTGNFKKVLSRIASLARDWPSVRSYLLISR